MRDSAKRSPQGSGSGLGLDVAGQGRGPSLLQVLKTTPLIEGRGLTEDRDRGADLTGNGRTRMRINNKGDRSVVHPQKVVK
jgi:hypothetical protein